MSDPGDMSRRQLLRGRFLAPLAGALADAVGQPVARATPTEPAAESAGSRRGSIPIQRPPGAVDETTFLRECTRCEACITACPHEAIVKAPLRFRQAAGTPMIDPAFQPCWMCPDTPCIKACEPGVLRPEQPLKMGRAMIVDQTCLAHQGLSCTVCSERCPVPGAIELTENRPRVVQDVCTGCGVCFFVCPAPSNAVIVMPLPDRPPRAGAADD